MGLEHRTHPWNRIGTWHSNVAFPAGHFPSPLWRWRHHGDCHRVLLPLGPPEGGVWRPVVLRDPVCKPMPPQILNFKAAVIAYLVRCASVLLARAFLTCSLMR